MNRPFRSALVLLTAGLLPLFAETSSRADIPAGYNGTPFDPAVAGGAGKIPSTVKAGPYPIPGRIDFINYDMGGLNVGYFTTDHVTNNGSESVMLALGYRTDSPTATLCLTNQVEKDEWYQTGDSTLDGTFFPSATTADYYIGAVRPGDWFNFTVNVATAGTYQLSSTWASGNGPPGGEGGDGSMELEVFVNNVMVDDWKAGFPNYSTEATFHNWVPYPNLGTITLDAGLQVIKLQSVDPHLNLAYVQFSLVQPDGGVDDGGASSGAASSDSGSIGTSGAGGASGAIASSGSTVTGESGAASTGGAAESGSASGASVGSGSTGGSGGAAASGGQSASGAAVSGSDSGGSGAKSSGCSMATPRRGSGLGFVLALAGVLLARSQRRARRA